MTTAYIVAAARTAGGRRGGRLRDWHPVDLAAFLLRDLVGRVDADPALIDDVILGCVGQAGEQSTNVARNVALASGLPETVPGVSVDRQCGSSQQALHFAAQAVLSETMDIVIAAGVESMTRCPMGLAQRLPAEAGLGIYKSPGLEKRYPGIVFSQFVGAEAIARKHGFSRESMDVFALHSHQKAADAANGGRFTAEILPVPYDIGGNSASHEVDEGIRFDASLEAISGVKLLNPDGLLTAATASQVCDGASGVIIANERGVKALGANPIGRIHHMTVLGGDPVVMLETPIAATERALKRAGMRLDDIDLYEVNEAFASIPMAWLKMLSADPERLNVNGGAIALGHPLGASGTKLMTTLIHALRARDKRFGLQTMCEGGGLANVTIVERL